MMDHKPMLTHLTELRNRLLVCALFYVFASVGAYYFVEDIYHYLTLPLAKASELREHRLIYTGLTEAFFTYIKLSCFAGFIISFPVIAHQIYYFVAPALYKKEKKSLLPYLIAAPTLFMMGALLVYFYVMPLAWRFFVGFETSYAGVMPMVLEARVSEYLNLVISLIVGFGIAFQLPVVLLILTQVGVVSGKWLAEKRRFAIVIIFIAAALLTPPDVISQIALAIPLMLLYEISVLLCKKIDKTREK